MGLKAIGEYVEKSKVTQFLRRALSSYYFPLVTACVTVVSYCFGLEIIGIWYIGICATAVLICCKDITPLLSLFLALQIFISIKHSSSTYITAAGSRYMYSTAVLAQEIICIVMFAIPLIARTVLGVVKGRFKITPMFWGIALLAFVLLYNGLFYTHYSIKSFLYGCSLGAVLVGVFVFSSGNLVIDGKTFVRISLYMLAFFGTLVVQMIFAYSTIDGLIVNGTVNRYYLFMGWGTYNNLGMHLTVCIPAWFYLASRTKFGWAYLLGALANVVACFLSMSRQAMIMSLVIALACCVWIIVISKGKQRIINACVIGGVVVVTAIICGAMHAKLSAFFTSVIEGFKTGSGRIELWKTSLNNFLKKPLFGVGFFDPTAAYKDVGYS
ncbi:MAG: O-antigen ligase family protein, partial [Clostridia bacterium]|nr:O-antigen ligase family protein [Clostridia bacterium]